MKSLCISAFMAGVALLCLGCGGGKKVSMLEQQVSMLEQQADTLEAKLAKVQNERDALSLDKTLQKAELDIIRRDLNKLRTANDSLQTLVASPTVAEKVETPPAQTESLSAGAGTPATLQYDSVGVGIRQLQEISTLPAQPMAAGQPSAPPPDDLPVVSRATDFQHSYEQALALFKEKKYTESAQSFAALLEGDRSHRLSGNCQYWIGECLYAQNKYSEALAEFQKVFVYPNNFKADAAQFKIALCYLQLNKPEEAQAEFNRLIVAYPSSEFVSRALAQLEKLP